MCIKWCWNQMWSLLKNNKNCILRNKLTKKYADHGAFFVDHAHIYIWLLYYFIGFRISHIYKALNMEADGLSKLALLLDPGKLETEEIWGIWTQLLKLWIMPMKMYKGHTITTLNIWYSIYFLSSFERHSLDIELVFLDNPQEKLREFLWWEDFGSSVMKVPLEHFIVILYLEWKIFSYWKIYIYIYIYIYI